MIVTVTADIDENAKRVTLRGSQPALHFPKTFLVAAGDTLEWKLRDVRNTPPNLGTVRVRFVEFPPGGRDGSRPLLDRGNEPETTTDVISGTVSSRAFPGDYRYQVELVRGSEIIKLDCFWGGSLKDDPVSSGMGGGEKSGGPRG